MQADEPTVSGRHDDPAPQDARLSLVTVVFEAELPLLELQARSLARFVAPTVFADIVIIDNTVRGIASRRRTRLLAAYGPWRPAVRFVRPADLARLPPTRGWVGQQVLKLAVHALIDTPFYVVLDAKNHWIRPTLTSDFVNPDGRARGARHSYRNHALRDSLVRVLDYLGVEAEPWLDDFPVTHTPVVLETDVVGALVTAVETSAGRPFAEEFVAAHLTEFFLYAGWLIATYGGFDTRQDGVVVRAATVWPSQSTAADFERVLHDARQLDAPFLSVHRTALARAGRAAVTSLADFWVERSLFSRRRRALVFVARYKSHYLATMTVRKVRSMLADRRTR